jgi:acyl carrier protein
MLPREKSFEWVLRRACQVSGLPAERVTGLTALEDLGMDSVTVAGFVVDLEEHFGVSLGSEGLQGFANIRALVDHLVEASPGG